MALWHYYGILMEGMRCLLHKVYGSLNELILFNQSLFLLCSKNVQTA
jgi:hypothetical protein